MRNTGAFLCTEYIRIFSYPGNSIAQHKKAKCNTVYRENSAPVLFFSLFALWHAYVRKLENGQFQDRANQSKISVRGKKTWGIQSSVQYFTSRTPQVEFSEKHCATIM